MCLRRVGEGGVRWFKVGCSAGDQGSKSKVVEDFAAVSPYIGAAVFAQTFVVEAVNSRDLS